MEEPAQYIDFMIKYRDWVSIHRESFDESVRPEEIAFVLSTIRQSIENKYYKILGIDTAKLDLYIADITAGQRGYKGLAKVAGALESHEARETAESACANKDLRKVAESYIISRAADTLGVKTYIDMEELIRVFPDLKLRKPAKPRGRKPAEKSGA